MGDYPLFNITSGSLPIGVTLNADSGIISGIPSSPSILQNVIIEASNPVGAITTTLQFTVMNRPINTPVIIVVSVIIVLLVLLIVMIMCHRNQSPTLPVKTIDEVKSVENRVSKPVIVDNDSSMEPTQDKPSLSIQPVEITVESDSTTLTVVESTTVEPNTIIEPVVTSQEDKNATELVEVPDSTSENKD